MKRYWWIALSVLMILTVALAASASCPYPSGSSGGNGWSGGHPQTYIYDVSISPLSDSILIVNACDYGTTNCAASNINFQGKVHFTRGGSDFHAYPGFPLRQVSVTGPGLPCTYPGGTKYCITFSSDIDVGSQINELQNGAQWYMEPASSGYPASTMSATAPLGWGVVKIAGMGSSPAQTLRVNYVNSTHTGIATANFGFTGMTCP